MYLEERVRERNLNVRILMPSDKSTEDVVRQLKENYQEHIDIRYIEKMSDTKATILVVDRKVSLVMEIRDDSKLTFDEAIGLSTYSSSRPGVLSYVSIFENLWKQTELYEQLKQQDIMQKEFINIAAHELKTPIQPILTLTEVLRSQTKDVKQQEILEITTRNAKRLQRLSNDILDVSKIEGKSPSLCGVQKHNYVTSASVFHFLSKVKLPIYGKSSLCQFLCVCVMISLCVCNDII